MQSANKIENCSAEGCSVGFYLSNPEQWISAVSKWNALLVMFVLGATAATIFFAAGLFLYGPCDCR
jgi:hypothetical protein